MTSDLFFDLYVEGDYLALIVSLTLKAGALATISQLTGNEKKDALRAPLFDNEGNRYDVVDAVLALGGRGFDPYQAKKSVVELGGWVKRPDWSTI